MSGLNVVLRKVSGGTRIRGQEVVGTTGSEPRVGQSFSMLSEPFDKAPIDGLVPNLRLVETSPVAKLTYDDESGLYSFTTESGSQYTVQVLDSGASGKPFCEGDE